MRTELRDLDIAGRAAHARRSFQKAQHHASGATIFGKKTLKTGLTRSGSAAA
jgi:hypothetical protein